MIKKGINKNSHYFVQLRPIRNYGFVSLTCSSDEPIWTECKIVENRYKLEDGYKLELQSLDERFGTESYYQSDFVSLVEGGHIIEKTNESQHVEFVKWFENVGGFEITHTANVVTD